MTVNNEGGWSHGDITPGFCPGLIKVMNDQKRQATVLDKLV